MFVSKGTEKTGISIFLIIFCGMEIKVSFRKTVKGVDDFILCEERILVEGFVPLRLLGQLLAGRSCGSTGWCLFGMKTVD